MNHLKFSSSLMGTWEW